MFCCCDPSSKLLDDIYRIDQEEQRPLQLSDIPPCPADLEPELAAAELDAAFQQELANTPPDSDGRNGALRRACVSEYGGTLLASALFRLAYEGFSVSMPFVAKLLIDDVIHSKTPASAGAAFGYALALVGMTFGLLFSLALSTNVMMRGLNKLQGAVMILLFRKLESLPRESATLGETSTLIVSETQAARLCFWMGAVLANPLALIANVIALFFIAGVPGVVGAIVVVLFGVFQAILSSTFGVGQRGAYLSAAETRVRRCAEYIGAMKLIKLSGWTANILETVAELREVETGALARLVTVRAAIISLSHAVPQLSLLAVFSLVYGFFSDDGSQTTSVFLVIILLNSVRITVASFSLNFSRAADLWLSLDRWQSFLLAPARRTYTEQHKPTDGDDAAAALQMSSPVRFGVVTSEEMLMRKKGSGGGGGASTATAAAGGGDGDDGAAASASFIPKEAVRLGGSGGGDSSKFFLPLLEDINISISKGSLVAITGPLASGKSVLLRGLIGLAEASTSFGLLPSSAASDEQPNSPVTIRANNVVYSGDPWIISSSLRNNICMHRLDEAVDAERSEPGFWTGIDTARYAEALWCAGLVGDLASFPQGDLTCVGERGQSVSGGQKQRIALARAIYQTQRGSLVALDDPLSAIDPELVVSVFDRCIRTALAGRTRLVVTHQKELLGQFDRVLHLEPRRGGSAGGGGDDDADPAAATAAACRVVFDGNSREYADFLAASSKVSSPTTAAEPAAELPAAAEGEYGAKQLSLQDEIIPDAAPAAAESSSASPAPKPKFADLADFTASVRDAFERGVDVDGVKRSATDSVKDTTDTAAGTLIKKEQAMTSATSSTTSTMYWYAGHAPWLFVGVAAMFIVWRGSISISDIALSLWSNNQQSSTVFNATSMQNVTTVSYRFYSNETFMVFFALAIVVSFVAILFRVYLYVRAVGRAGREMHSELFSAICAAPMSWHDTTERGAVVARLSKDMEQTDVALAEELFFSSSIIVNTVGLLVSICIAAPLLIGWFVLIGGIFVHARQTFVIGLRGAKRLEDVARNPIVTTLAEVSEGLSAGTVQTFTVASSSSPSGTERISAVMLRRFTLHVRELTAAAESFRLVQKWILERLSLIGALVVLGTTVIAVVLRLYLDAVVIDSSLLSLAVAYSTSAALNISYATSTSVQVAAIFSAVERIRQYIKELPQEEEAVVAESGGAAASSSSSDSDSAAVAIENNNNNNNEPIGDYDVEMTDKMKKKNKELALRPRRVIPPMPEHFPATGDLVFSDVCLRYRPGLPLVLKNVNFEIAAGERVGVCGASGGGKSSCFICISRIVELASGTITLGGRNIRDVPLGTLRAALTIVPQEAGTALFAGTVRSNLTPFGDHSDAELRAVVASIGGKNLERRLFHDGEGLDTLLSTGASELSSGERQLLVLCRAALKRSKIVMLDEASSALDAETDEMMQAALRSKAFDGSTFLTIAHRLGTIIHSTKIIVMEKGTVAEVGSPTELLANPGGKFYSMVAAMGPARLAELQKLAAEYEKERST